jgi:hypothetical protein
MSELHATDAASAVPSCPKCGGEMWDNREGKRNPKAPDFKCKDRGCDGVIWPPRGTVASTPHPSAPRVASTPESASPRTPAPTAAQQNPRRPEATAGAKVDSNGMPLCHICGGPMWDDRASKRNPRAPDFKCRNKPRERGGPGCEGVIWPARDGSPSPYPPPTPRRSASFAPPPPDGPPPEGPPAWDGPPLDDDDVPF